MSNTKTVSLLNVSWPVAKKIPYKISQFGEIRIDYYFWLRGNGDNWKKILKDPAQIEPHILNHLRSENNYWKNLTQQYLPITKQIQQELLSRTPPHKLDIPKHYGDWIYWQEYGQDANYPTYHRRHKTNHKKDVLLDADKDSKDHEFFSLQNMQPSPNHLYIAYALDTVGSEDYRVYMRDIDTQQNLPTHIPHSSGNFLWSGDTEIIYVEHDENHRPRFVKRHIVGTDAAHDTLIFQEDDPTFGVRISKSLSGQYIFIQSKSSNSTEIRYLDTATQELPKLIARRQENVEYYVSHHNEFFYVRTNIDNRSHFKIARARIDELDHNLWKDVTLPEESTEIISLIALKDFLIRVERSEGLVQLVVTPNDGQSYKIDFDSDVYQLTPDEGFEYDTDRLRVRYQTLIDPEMIYEINLHTGQKTILMAQDLVSAFPKNEYVLSRKSITARDGTPIPVTLFHHQSVEPDGSHPLYLHTYGAYGHSIDVGFSGKALSLVDRGVIYAIAHVRGGGRKGKGMAPQR